MAKKAAKKKSTRAKKSAPVQAAAAPAPVAAKSSEVARVIDEVNMKKLLKRWDDRRTEVASITGVIREDIGHAVERFALDRQAFAVICKMYKMSDVRLAQFIDNLYHMMDISGITARADAVGTGFDLPQPQAEKTVEEEADEDQEVDDGKVSRPKFGKIEPAATTDPALASARAALEAEQRKNGAVA